MTAGSLYFPKPLLQVAFTDDAGFRYCVYIHECLLF